MKHFNKIITLIFVTLLSSTMFSERAESYTQIGTNNIIFINGIMNRQTDVVQSAVTIRNLVINSSIKINNDSRINQSMNFYYVYNPIGWGSIASKILSFPEDSVELLELKIDEEKYAEQLKNLSTPYNAMYDFATDQSSAKVVANYIDSMPAAFNGTKKAIYDLAYQIEQLDGAIVIAHSQGNILANLAYAYLAEKHGENFPNMMRIINIANTSLVSMNSLDLTHASDRALSALKLQGELSRRDTPLCNTDVTCPFQLAPPTFGELLSNISGTNHELNDVYLSWHTTPEPLFLNTPFIENIQYTPSSNTFRDRFMGLLEAAYNSFKKEMTFQVTTYGYSRVPGILYPRIIIEGYQSVSGFSYKIIRDGRVQANHPIEVIEGEINELIEPVKHSFNTDPSVTLRAVDNRYGRISIDFQVNNFYNYGSGTPTSIQYNDTYKICKDDVCTNEIEFDIEIQPCTFNGDIGSSDCL